ncbi:MAG TPA: GNAT family N-acetyltransferase, partial [Sphingobacteriaceae bacterium]|nr:GNAT family N-acetyltransferase [Sphingobacteriaceae bacterium]
MSSHTLRKARKEDCVRLLELVQELAEYEKAPEEVTVSIDEFIDSGFGEHPVWEAFVIELDGVIQGMALYYIRYSTWKGRRIYLEDIIVTQNMRGKGFGKILFDKVWQTCVDRNYSGLVWQVLDWNTPAINFYKKYPVDFDSGWLNATLENK